MVFSLVFPLSELSSAKICTNNQVFCWYIDEVLVWSAVVGIKLIAKKGKWMLMGGAITCNK
jgi:hypothetical protein